MKRPMLVFFIIVVIALAAASGWYYLNVGSPRLNVVLLSIDGLRPDHIGCYGHERDTTPNLDRMAKEGARFSTVSSSSTWSLPAHAALFTGLYDGVHMVTNVDRRLDEKRVTLAEALQDKGHRTAAIFTGPHLNPEFNLDQGFDQYIDATGKEGFTSPDVRGLPSRTTTRAMDKAEEWIASVDRRRPFFLFIQLNDLTTDLDPPPPYDDMFGPHYGGTIDGRDMYRDPRITPDMNKNDLEHLQALYDGEIRYIDDKGVARLVSFLKREGLDSNTLVVITSAHGFEFFEHGRLGHGNNLYDTTLTVPLIFWRPGLVPPKEIKNQASLIDVTPTIMDLLGFLPLGESLGESLRPRFKDPAIESQLPMYVELSRGGADLEGTRQTVRKLIVNNNEKQIIYFDLVKDPHEQSPVTGPANNDLRQALINFRALKDGLQKTRQAMTWTEGAGREKDVKGIEGAGYFQE